MCSKVAKIAGAAEAINVILRYSNAVENGTEIGRQLVVNRQNIIASESAGENNPIDLPGWRWSPGRRWTLFKRKLNKRLKWRLVKEQ